MQFPRLTKTLLIVTESAKEAIFIAQNVARIRKAKGVSQLELSLKIGYKSCSLVGGAEAGYKKIHFNLEHLYKIAKVLEIDINEFFK